MGHADEESVEATLARLAYRRFGLVTRAGLRAEGVSDKEIRSRLRSGALLREYPGVYRVGHRAPSDEATYMAAVLACGRGACLAGAAAAYALGLIDGRAPKPEVLAKTKRRVRGIVRHPRSRRHSGALQIDALRGRWNGALQIAASVRSAARARCRGPAYAATARVFPGHL